MAINETRVMAKDDIMRLKSNELSLTKLFHSKTTQEDVTIKKIQIEEPKKDKKSDDSSKKSRRKRDGSNRDKKGKRKEKIEK